MLNRNIVSLHRDIRIINVIKSDLPRKDPRLLIVTVQPGCISSRGYTSCNTWCSRYKPPQIMKKPARSNRMPARIIFGSGTRPEPYTMALGGVDTGSMNPKLAPRHAPSAGGNG